MLLPGRSREQNPALPGPSARGQLDRSEGGEEKSWSRHSTQRFLPGPTPISELGGIGALLRSQPRICFNEGLFHAPVPEGHRARVLGLDLI